MSDDRDVSRGTGPDQRKLSAYVELVRHWGRKLDLVSPRDLERFEERHVEDCLRAAPFLAGLAAGPAIDVGSGAGLPGIPLALAQPDRLWRLLEPRGRRAAFLEEAVRLLELENCEVVLADAETAAADPGLAATHICATARALATPPAAFDLVLPLVQEGGHALVFVGAGADLPPGAGEWAPGLAILRKSARYQGESGT